MFAHNLFFFFITAMAITKDEGRTGGKICKQLPRRVPFTPYNRPRSVASEICQPPPANEAGRSGWFAKKLFDSAAWLVVNRVSQLFSVFVKDIAATPGENTGAMEEASQRQAESQPFASEQVITSVQPTDPCPIPSSSFVQPIDRSPITSSSFESSQIVKAAEKLKSSYEVREQGGNSIDVRLSICYDGSDTSRQELISHIHDVFQLEEQLNQKKFSRSEINKEEDLLLSRTTEKSTLGGVNLNICEDGFESPIEIAKAYLASKPRNAAPYILNSQKNNASAFSLQFGNRLARAQVASRSGSCFPAIPVDYHNNKMAQESRAKSTLYKFLCPRYSNPPYCRYAMRAKIKGYIPKCKCGELRTLKWTTSPSNFRSFGHGNALKRGSSDMDAGCAGDARRVRQKSC